MNALPARLLVVTDRHQARRALGEIVADVIPGGARWIWLRDKDLRREDRRTLARQLRAMTALAGASLTIGADIELAADIAADGVHLGAGREGVAAARKRLGPAALIGVSAHSLDDVVRARGDGADYVTLSPIFASVSKPGYGPALGIGVLGEATTLGVPVLALGGVTAETAGACMDAGAAGIAVMGPIMRAEAPAETAEFLRSTVNRGD